MQRHWRLDSTLGIAALLLTAGCGGGEEGPSESPPAIAKAPTMNGDAQTGPAGQILPSALRVVVTRDGNPAADVTVAWSTTSGGSLAPANGKTDADGISSSVWTLGTKTGDQSATASVTGATGTPVTFTATATESGPTGPMIAVRSPDVNSPNNRFEPADLTVELGTTVTWVWAPNAVGHNIVPDDNSTPAASGTLADAPHSYQYTFTTLGTFRYHCLAHGTAGGGGMSGTITVIAAGN